MANVLTRGLWQGYKVVRWHVVPRLGHQVMRHRSPTQVVSVWPEGEVPLGPHVCVFTHWDGAGDVRPHVLHQIRSLAAAGMSVLFVTNAGSLRPAALEALKPICAGVMVRRNVGYDFGAWREGLAHLNLPRADTAMVVIANDSVYGPLAPLDEMLTRIDLDVADVWGCTDTWQSRYHLQSYFMAFSPRVIASEAWRNFWAQVRPTWAKSWLIRLYEVGLTQSLLRAGFTCRAIWPYQVLVADIDPKLLEKPRDDDEDGPNHNDPAVKARRQHAVWVRDMATHRIPLNPTNDLWRQLLAAGFPFIKRELLRDNPTHVEDVGDWRQAVGPAPGGVVAAIERDLQRVMKDRAP